MSDYAVVGSGIGGSSIAAYLSAKGFDVVLFEKEPYLGGCSSSFTHAKHTYNTGATTFAGYDESQPLKRIFDAVGFTPNLIMSEPSIVVMQNSKITPRYKDLELFLEVMQKNYPHPKNREFWTLIHTINRDFYAINGYYYSNASLLAKIKSLTSYMPLFFKFAKYLCGDASNFIETFFGTISEEYKQFLEAQILIVAQAPTKEINFFTAALSLGYTFGDNYYVVGGFSALFEGLTSKVKEVHKKSEILSIQRDAEGFILHTKEKSFRAKKVILNSTVYEIAELFDDLKIKNYYKKYEKLNNHQSSFMLYMTLKSEQEFHHHYQIIKEKTFPHAISSAAFVSFSDKSDTTFAPRGYYSVTASIHTDTRFWEDKSSYQSKKEELKAALQNCICDTLSIEESVIIDAFGATPNTFKRYINRSQLGGNAITIKNFLPKLPTNDTRIEGLYNVGDTVYAAQGWSGVMHGVENLTRVLDV